MLAAVLALALAAGGCGGSDDDKSGAGDKGAPLPQAASTSPGTSPTSTAPTNRPTGKPTSPPPGASACQEFEATVVDVSSLLSDADGADPATLDKVAYQTAVQILTRMRPKLPAAAQPYLDWLLAELQKVLSGTRYRFDVEANTREAAPAEQAC